MKAYGQFCPLAQAAQLLCERWTLLVVRELIAGSTRFSELQKGVPLMSPTLLSARLKQLSEAGVIERRGKVGSYQYELTRAGHELRPIVEMVGAWGHRWARSNLSRGDLDASLLMWDIRRTIDAAAFPRHRVVLQFEFPDAGRGAGDWWLVSEGGEIDLCLADPGHEVDVLVRTPLKALTEVWICERSFSDAVRSGDIKALGDAKLIGNLEAWLCGSPLARLGSLGEMAKVTWSEA